MTHSLIDTGTFTSHMAEAADPLVAAVAARLGMGWVGGTWHDRLTRLRNGSIDAGWICGLLYAELHRRDELDLVPVAAPVMAAPRYGDRPIYFGDLIVHVDSDIATIDDVGGRRLAFNEPSSLSGYRMLLDRFDSLNTFSETVASGSHGASMRMVIEGAADVACIDSTLLDMLAVRDPAALEPVRVVAGLGPYPAPPIVALVRVAGELQERLTAMHNAPGGRSLLASWGVHRFATVESDDYATLAAQR